MVQLPLGLNCRWSPSHLIVPHHNYQGHHVDPLGNKVVQFHSCLSSGGDD